MHSTRRQPEARVISCASLIILLSIFLLAPPSYARDFKASLAQMPVFAESRDKGVSVDLVKAIARVSGATITYELAPFKRSLQNVIDGEVDFHIPLIKNPTVSEDSLNYDYGTTVIHHVNFVLFTNKDKPVDMNKLADYQIETDAAHVKYFPFKITPSSDITASLRKVNAGRIDGFIFADSVSDPIIKKEQLSNIKRQLYKVFDSMFVLPKGKKGGETDQMLSAAMKKLADQGELKNIVRVIDQPYDPWQP